MGAEQSHVPSGVTAQAVNSPNPALPHCPPAFVYLVTLLKDQRPQGSSLRPQPHLLSTDPPPWSPLLTASLPGYILTAGLHGSAHCVRGGPTRGCVPSSLQPRPVGSSHWEKVLNTSQPPATPTGPCPGPAASSTRALLTAERGAAGLPWPRGATWVGGKARRAVPGVVNRAELAQRQGRSPRDMNRTGSGTGP